MTHPHRAFSGLAIQHCILQQFSKLNRAKRNTPAGDHMPILADASDLEATPIERMTRSDIRHPNARGDRRDSILGFGATGRHYKKQGVVFRARTVAGVYFIAAKDARHAHEIATRLGHKPTEMFACPEHIAPNFNGAVMIKA